MQSASRRQFLQSLAGCAAVGAGAAWTTPRLFAQPTIPAVAGKLITPPTAAAVDRGLEYLAAQQQSGEGEEEGAFRRGTYSRNVAVVSLAGLAFMASGSTADRGPYAEQISRAVGYILRNTRESGFICYERAASHGPMYGHGFATLFLAEAYGTTRRNDLRKKLAKAVKLIINTQNREGGWRYQPEPREADISVTVCQVMALRAARNAGIHVPSETIKRCIEYVKKCHNSDGGFRYMLPPGVSAFPRSAAGLVALYSAGVYDGPEVEQSLKYLSQYLPSPERSVPGGHYFYGQYYAAQAMWLAGEEYAVRWFPAIGAELLRLQRADGAWMDDLGREYGTAMAAIVLQVPRNMLPIFQR